MGENLIGGKYEIVDVLGRGAASTVYAGKNARTGRRVAIKLLSVPVAMGAGDPGLVRFEQEARIAGSLESPHIAAVLDIDLDAETSAPFLVMELLEGEDLESLLGRVGPLAPDAALRIAAQACQGLAAAHAAGVVHRDVKPANLFLARGEKGEVVVKILDFGIAKIPRATAGARDGGLAAPQVSITETGQLLGSPLFMSPEQVKGASSVDARSDVFSIGCTLYSMLVGAAPHAETRSFVELLRRITTEPPRPLRDVAPWVPAGAAAVVEEATRLSREERFASAAAMRDAIRALLPDGEALRVEMLAGADRTAIVPARMGVSEGDPFAATVQARPVQASPASPAGGSPRRWLPIAIAVLLLGIAAVAAMRQWQ